MLTHPGRTLRRPPRRTLTALIAVSAALGMSLLTTSAAQAGEVIEKVMDENFQVSESSSGEDTGFDVRSGDRLVITGGGKIKSGLFGQDWVFPDGGNQNDTRAELPLNQSTLYDKTCAGWFGARHRCSPSYSLIGVFGGHPRYFLIGSSYDSVYTGETSRLRLRTNDDAPGGGEGAFTADVQVYRALPDGDNDGVPDQRDNCPSNSNPDQRDADGDRVGDACDSSGEDPGPGVDEGYFRVTLNGFKVLQQTDDHAFEVDGKGDEVYLRNDTRLVGGTGATIAQDDYSSPVLGDTNGWPARLKAGSASDRGGLKTGDGFPTATPWNRSDPLTNDPPQADREIVPPLILAQEKLTDGRNGLVVSPSVWEWDGGRGLFNRFVDAVAKYGSDASRLASLIAGQDQAFEDRLADNLEKSLPALKGIVEGTVGEPQDRPVGMADSGEDYTFKPKSLFLNYDVADRVSKTTFSHGKGVVAMEFQDSQRIGGGRYAVYLQVERVEGPPVDGGGDKTPPVTTIASKPSALVNSGSATLGFSSSESNSRFECSLDGGNFTPCASPKSYSGLANGRHTFQVRAIDAAGNVDPVGATAVWTVDTRKPVTTIASKPSALVNSGSATLGFSSSESNSRFECSLDGGNFTPCASPKSYSGLANGRHTFQVRAIDAAGNVDPVGATAVWTVDTLNPRVTRVRPGAGARGVAPGTNVVADFSEAMRATTVNRTTVQLKKTGSPQSISAVVTRSGPYRVVLNPRQSLQRGATYVATVGTGAMDVAGNRLDGDPRRAGLQPKRWSFRVGR